MLLRDTDLVEVESPMVPNSIECQVVCQQVPIQEVVFKGHRMAGRMGNERVTVQNLEIVRVDNDKNLILIKRCNTRS